MEQPGAAAAAHNTRAANDPSVFTITEKALVSTFTFNPFAAVGLYTDRKICEKK